MLVAKLYHVQFPGYRPKCVFNLFDDLKLDLQNINVKIAQFFSLSIQEMKIVLSHATTSLSLEEMSFYFEDFL
jgi:hypothetical protein